VSFFVEFIPKYGPAYLPSSSQRLLSMLQGLVAFLSRSINKLSCSRSNDQRARIYVVIALVCSLESIFFIKHCRRPNRLIVDCVGSFAFEISMA
jgi:hypothetical protein